MTPSGPSRISPQNFQPRQTFLRPLHKKHSLAQTDLSGQKPPAKIWHFTATKIIHLNPQICSHHQSDSAHTQQRCVLCHHWQHVNWSKNTMSSLSLEDDSVVATAACCQRQQWWISNPLQSTAGEAKPQGMLGSKRRNKKASPKVAPAKKKGVSHPQHINLIWSFLLYVLQKKCFCDMVIDESEY